MRPQRVRIIGITSGCVTLKKPSSETSMTRCHCSRRIAGKTASSWMPALLTSTWTGPPSSSCSQAASRGVGVGDVEGDRLAAAAGGDDALDHRFGRMRAGRCACAITCSAVAAEALGDRRADARRWRR